MSCCCGGGGAGAGGSGGSLLTGVADSLNYTGKAPTLWVGADAQQAGLADSVNNAAWWGQVLVVVAATAGVVWVVHRMFFKR